ncbi:hypothetical protein [Aureibaculum marinum]|uniref:hypothetical protein n=1 Tax=Aureibaculum marinum TaxID=2487930 RepID=UPI00193A8782|nr:hypothetical protein [Aureibaculum marinum]
MKTGNLKYTRKIYKLDSVSIGNKYRTYKTNKPNNLFTNIIRIEKDNGYHDRSRFFEHWLYFRNDTNWKRCTKTGLAKTVKPNVYEGNISELIKLKTKNHKGKDWENEKHFLIVQFSIDFKTIVVDIFQNFYPRSKILIEHLINEHNLHYKL